MFCTGSGSKLSGCKAYPIKCQLYKMELPPFLLFIFYSVFVQPIISFPNYLKKEEKKKRDQWGDALKIKSKSINKFILKDKVFYIYSKNALNTLLYQLGFCLSTHRTSILSFLVHISCVRKLFLFYFILCYKKSQIINLKT